MNHELSHELSQKPKRAKSPDQNSSFSQAVFQFVYRTKEPVILGEAQQSIFSNDSYIQQRRPRSILCLSIRDSVQRDGIAYSECQNTQNAQDASNAATDIVEALTSRELEIVRFIAEGLSNKQIASRLSITEGTVKTHANNIYGKLNRRIQAINKAKELQLLS
ncbi:response regulator transcription factor [Paenibacillus sp. IB182496]|uniref:Response regulator transcription factor n=2 Tax=Paenibacillus sabuli TaxID=2772509 RepID=A0A927GS65_9BACL|nr:response regulator transcription factor [Paenibacillus sabuli]